MKIPHQPTFFFFDYETFGVSPAKDRPCQFAGVRTDMNFNIIGEPLVIYCQPPADYLPQPEACLITGITPQLAMREGLPEPEFINKIHEELSHPDTCALGYNNIRFDDEVTRYTLYRNFFDPYAWSWQNRNSRWDLLDIMRAYYALRPEGIEWPLNDEGLTSFKLEHLSVANGIEHSNAHDAMADVHATIEMAKRLKKAQPRLFDYAFNHRHKNQVRKLIDVVEMKPLVHVSGMFGVTQNNISLIAPVAWHPNNDNAVITIDLSKDLSPLFELGIDALRERLYTKRIDLAEHELPAPIKLVHLNKSPFLAELKVLRPEDETRLQFNRAHCLENAALLKSNPEIRQKLIAVFEIEKSKQNTDVDSSLYSGFFSAADRASIEMIRKAKPEHLPAFELNVMDKRIEPLLFRYRARNFPLTLDEKEQQQWFHHCQDYFSTALEGYFEKLALLASEHQQDPKKLTIIQSLVEFAQSKQL